MGIEQQIATIVEKAVKDALKGVEMPKNDKSNDCLLTTKQAAKYLACSTEYIRSLQDKGILSLVFLPGSKQRRVFKSEVLGLIKKNFIVKKLAINLLTNSKRII